MEKTISPEQLYWIIGMFALIFTPIVKFVYDLWKQQSSMKFNYINRFEEARKDAEHIHTNLDSKIDSVKSIFDEKLQFLTQSLEHSLTKMEDRFDTQLGRILDKLDEQNKTQLDFYKNYEVTPKKERSRKDV